LEKILYFDYCSFFILAILLISTIFRGMTKGRPNKAYIELLIVSMLATIFDILAVFLDNHGAGNVMLKYITHSGYLILHNLTPPFYIIYLMLLSDTDHKMKRNKIIPFSVPISIVLILLLSNPWHKKLFYMDAADCYTRGPLFPALYLCAAFYVIWGLVHLIRYRQSYGRGRFFSLFGMYPIMIAATVAQMLMPQILFEMLANALGMLLISTMIQRAEDFIDTETGLGKKSAYATDIDRAMVNGKSYALIMINLTNYTALSNMLGYTALLDLLRKVSHVFTDLNAEHNFGAAIYYIGDGKFRFILDYRHLSMAEQAAEVINGAMKTDVLVMVWK
jgi:GGDEF domain-containing protein